MPVLARALESAGMSTILVSMMPYWAEKVGTPRTLAVEFPFGHTLGAAHNVMQQMGVIEQALQVLEEADTAGTIVHSQETWPIPAKEAFKAWQPKEPSPIIGTMAPHLRQMIREHRQRR